jgi:hypothetical protein
MSTSVETRLLNANERAMVSATRRPHIGQLSDEQLKAISERLRKAHKRAKDISAQQKREMRGKVNARGTKPTRDNAGTQAKVLVLREAGKRVQSELERRENKPARVPTQAELSRRALKLRLSGQTRAHRDSKQTASQGMKPKPRKKPLKIGTTKREIGRVSQAGKIAQARKDGRSR